MNKPSIFAIGLGVGALIGVGGHMLWTLGEGIRSGLIEAGNAAASVTYMQITIDELERESNLLRALAVRGLEGMDKQDLLAAIAEVPPLATSPNTTESEVLVSYDQFSSASLIFEDDQLAWITNHCERRATDPAACRTMGAN